MGNFNFEMSEQLHKSYKIKCIAEGIDMQDKVVKLIKEFTEKKQ